MNNARSSLTPLSPHSLPSPSLSSLALLLTCQQNFVLLLVFSFDDDKTMNDDLRCRPPWLGGQLVVNRQSAPKRRRGGLLL